MSNFNQHLYSLGIQKVIEIYLKHYFDIHGDILPGDGLYERIMKEMEKPLLEEALRRLNGNQVKAAQLLGINRNTLRNKIRELNICLDTL